MGTMIETSSSKGNLERISLKARQFPNQGFAPLPLCVYSHYSLLKNGKLRKKHAWLSEVSSRLNMDPSNLLLSLVLFETIVGVFPYEPSEQFSYIRYS